MKILVIGDIHGRDIWKNFADIKFLLTAEPDTAGYHPFEPDYDKYIFLGDYCDSYTKTNEEIKYNLLEIINFKKLYPNNVVLLWGNHDVEYWKNLPWMPSVITITGFRPESHYDLFEIFNRNYDLFQLAFQYQNYLFTHAGVHFGWYHYVFTKAIKGKGWQDLTIAEQLNNAFDHRIECLFDVDFYRGGRKKVGGPLWCSKQLVGRKPLKNCHQIVGHTPTDNVVKLTIKENTTITFCDILDKKKDCYLLNI